MRKELIASKLGLKSGVVIVGIYCRYTSLQSNLPAVLIIYCLEKSQRIVS